MTEVLLSSTEIMHGMTRVMDFSSSSETGASRADQEDPFMLYTQDGLRKTGAGAEALYMLHTQDGLRKIIAGGHGNRHGRGARAMEESISQASSSGAGPAIGEAVDSRTKNLPWKTEAGHHFHSEEVHQNLNRLHVRRSAGIGRGVAGDGAQPSAREVRVLVSDDDRKVQAQISLLALLLAAFRRSGLTCQSPQDKKMKMDIGWPTDVQHVTHVTFDRFNGFLGLPVEFELEIPRRVPSASASVFGVSAESMQCSYDRHGNSVPTILLLLQETLYNQGGLKAEGIFRINAENSQEEHVRDQLNKGNVPMNIDVHCLAGLIKAWLRELPRGVLDSLPPDQLLQCSSEEESLALVKLLPSTEAALLDWAVNLMADVVQEEEANKMNARNVAMVFAPNMTQMSDPLTALMHAVQVMNFLKALILKVLQDRRAGLNGCKPGAASGVSVPIVSWNAEPHKKDKTGNKVDVAHADESLLPENASERKGGADHNDKCSVNVEERFFKGFRGISCI